MEVNDRLKAREVSCTRTYHPALAPMAFKGARYRVGWAKLSGPLKHLAAA